MQEKSTINFQNTLSIWRWVYCIAIVVTFIPFSAIATSDSTIIISADFPHFGTEKKLVQDLYFSTKQQQAGHVEFNCYRYSGTSDSIRVFGQKGVALKLKSGAGIYPISFGVNDANSFVLPTFYDILHHCGVIPAGSYKTFIVFTSDSGTVTRTVLRLQADSTLPATSSLSKQLNEAMVPPSKPNIWGRAKSTVSGAVPASKTLARNASKINRLFKSRGLTQQIEQRDNKSIVSLWYQDWFVGRYEMEAEKSAASQIQHQRDQITGNISSLAGTELESYRSLFSQVRELNKNSNQDKELKGELALSGNWSNGQPEYSAQDNNYYEVRADAAVEIMDIPVTVEGYYTTQDAHRQVKSSYARVHYDADKAKEKLMKLITGYKSQFSQTVAKGKGLDQVYGSYLGNLDGMKTRLIAEIYNEAGLPYKNGESFNTEGLQTQIESRLAAKMKDTAGLANTVTGKVDSAGRAQAIEARAVQIKDSATHLYNRAIKRYEQVKALEAKYEKYEGLLDQYKKTSYFDSALAYSKMSNLKNGDETTYKQLAKSASGLLPEGKAKSFIAGLTNLDIGIFPKYISKYTQAGQQMKGLDVGYDIGFAKVGMNVGSTEYVGRDGSLDKYTTYSGSMAFTPAPGQHASLVYYGYTPSKSMVHNDDFFKNTDIALPSFRQPVHIVSASYDGIIAKRVRVEAEAASSFRSGSGAAFNKSFDADRTAWHINAESKIPHTPLAASASYEHGGKNFQNSTLPTMIAGSELYKIGLKGDFFRSFLTAGLEYNYMQQTNLYSKGGNSRWGFDIATHSKQYPSLAFSYKPFSTFRSYSDTFAIPQRPLQGAVWTGKATYQIKRLGGKSYRFSAVLNRNSSHSDSVRYDADLLQLNAVYTTKQWMVMVSGGQSNLATNSGNPISTDTLNPAHIKTTFGMLGASYKLSKGLDVNAGFDLGFTPFGFSKWGINGGINYRMKIPLTLRASGRYSSYRLEGYSGNIGTDNYGKDMALPLQWRKLISGSLELIWQFKMKMKG